MSSNICLWSFFNIISLSSFVKVAAAQVAEAAHLPDGRVAMSDLRRWRVSYSTIHLEILLERCIKKPLGASVRDPGDPMIRLLCATGGGGVQLQALSTGVQWPESEQTVRSLVHLAMPDSPCLGVASAPMFLHELSCLSPNGTCSPQKACGSLVSLCCAVTASGGALCCRREVRDVAKVFGDAWQRVKCAPTTCTSIDMLAVLQEIVVALVGSHFETASALGASFEVTSREK
ncbi:unnamed protein product [Symbiodinium sp. CCMP2592]|nr:unnamed protein product [Symbiodinium sp. CCMP2592]